MLPSAPFAPEPGQMAEQASFLAELEDAVSKGTAESCARALWHATDVLIAGSYSEDEIWTFGEIIGRLADEIEASARARLAGKLAASNNAPLDLVRRLASDYSIDVAGPVLRQSTRLDVKTLVSCAQNRSQQHLLAISERKSIPEAVTDILVVRGSREVVTSVAANNGAVFSSSGFLHLVRRSEGDSILAEFRRSSKGHSPASFPSTDFESHGRGKAKARARTSRAWSRRSRRPSSMSRAPSMRDWSGLKGLFHRQESRGKAARERRVDGRQGVRIRPFSQVQ